MHNSERHHSLQDDHGGHRHGGYIDGCLAKRIVNKKPQNKQSQSRRYRVNNTRARHRFNIIEQIHITETAISTPTTRHWINNTYELSPIKC